MRTESEYVQKPQYYKAVPADSTQRSEKANGTTVPVGQNNSSNIDSFKRNEKFQLSGQDAKRYESIYKHIENICKEQDIDIQLAKDFGLLEKIAGVMTKAELIQLDDNKINTLVAILSDSLGWGDGLGFGEKDVNDLTKLVKDIHEKMALKKTGGSKWGQSLHNIKKGIKSLFSDNTVENCKNENEVSVYYQKKYLNNIKNANSEEKIKTYQELLREFYYDFNAQKSTEKQVQMIKSIENLAANDRAIMVKVIENSFIQNPSALALFGKILDMNFESIVLSRDGFNNTVGKLEATAISHTAYRHMSEEDINNSLSRNKDRAMSFMSENYNKVNELRKKQANGGTLTIEEENLLLRAECFETRYAGALTGISANYNLTGYSKESFMSRISNDTAEIGIQEAVFRTVEEFIKSNPDVVLMPKEKFTELMDKITDGYYSKVVNSTNSQNIINKKPKDVSDKKNNDLKDTKNKSNKTDCEKNVASETIEDMSLGNTEESEVTHKKNKVKIFEKNSEKTNQVKPLSSAKTVEHNSSTNEQKEITNNIKQLYTLKNLEIAAQKGVESIKEYKENTNINDYDLTIEILNMSNTSAQIKDWALDKFDTWNETQKAENCSRITNNANKIRAGRLISSITALHNVDCNNFYVKSEFEKLIQKQEENTPNSNTHLSTQKSFC